MSEACRRVRSRPMIVGCGWRREPPGHPTIGTGARVWAPACYSPSNPISCSASRAAAASSQGMHPAGHLDRLLVALSAQHDHVPGRRRRQRPPDRLAPVRDEQQVLAAPPAERLRAGRDLARGCSSRSSDRGSSSVSTISAAPLGRHAAHHRPLERVAVAGRAEDGRPARHRPPPPAAPGCRAPWRANRPYARSRRRRERLALLDPLHPAGHRRQAPPARPGSAAGSRSSASPTPTAASALWTLKRPGSRRCTSAAQRGVATATRSPEASSRTPVGRIAAAGSAPYVMHRRACVRAPRSRSPRETGSSRLSTACLPQPFSGIHGGERKPFEETPLRRPVGLQRAVELEVLVGDVRQRADVVRNRADAILGQPVRRRLDDGEPIPGRHHPREVALEIGRLWCWWRGRRCPG